MASARRQLLRRPHKAQPAQTPKIRAVRHDLRQKYAQELAPTARNLLDCQNVGSCQFTLRAAAFAIRIDNAAR